jgi:hypothetical protein
MSDMSGTSGFSAPTEASTVPEERPRRRGRPVLGAICGFLLGLFIGLDLLLFGVLPLNSIVLTILPFVGLVAGFFLSRSRG